MKRQYKILIIVVLAVFFFRVCLSNEKKKENNQLKPTSNTLVDVSITPNFTTTSLINTKIFGINIGYAFARELDKDSGFVQLLRAMHPASLRFPGGTVGNWYHPNLPVYGYKANEILPSLGGLYALQTKRSENILYNYIRLCKTINCGAVYCANVLNGTSDEILFVLDELKKKNIPILGVELGNEFTLLPYREKIFTSANVYIEKTKQTVDAIKKKYPDLKIAIVAGDAVPMDAMDGRSKFMRTWNQDMAKQDFYNAYVWHFYAACSQCDKNIFFDSIYLKNLKTLAPYNTTINAESISRYTQLFGKDRKIWLTEWNLSNGEYLDNTFVQAAYVSENFLQLLDINTKQNNIIELTNLHVIDGLINVFKGKQAPVFSNGNDNATVQYFAFKFLASTLTNTTYRGEVDINCSDKTVANNFVCSAFVNKEMNKTYLHFVNRSGNKITLKINATPKNAMNLTAIEADVPYATAGKTNYEKNYPNKVKPIRYREEKLTSNTVTIAPFAFGYISY